MSEAIHFSLTDQQIRDAEIKRTQGYLNQAVQLTEPAVTFPMDRFPQLGRDEQTRLLMGARINVVATTSRAKKSWEAPTVAHFLGEAKQGIMTIYQDPSVKEVLPEMREDTFGNPYEFRTEMARDEVRYTMVLSALTGNADLLRGAIRKLNRVIETAQEPTARTLTVFERDRLVFEANNQSATDFESLSGSYRAAIAASSEVGNWERVATIASWYSLDAKKQGNVDESRHALAVFTHAAEENPVVSTIFEHERQKAKSEQLLHTQWRRSTPEGMDYAYLALPEEG